MVRRKAEKVGEGQGGSEQISEGLRGGGGPLSQLY